MFEESFKFWFEILEVFEWGFDVNIEIYCLMVWFGVGDVFDVVLLELFVVCLEFYLVVDVFEDCVEEWGFNDD